MAPGEFPGTNCPSGQGRGRLVPAGGASAELGLDKPRGRPWLASSNGALGECIASSGWNWVGVPFITVGNWVSEADTEDPIRCCREGGGSLPC